MIPTNTVLVSPNYRLRIPDETDYDFVFSATRYQGFNDGMAWDPPAGLDELIAPLERAIQAWMEGRGYGFTIETNEESSVRIGKISIRKTDEVNIWNVGFWTHPEHQKKGVMSEVLATILEFGFTKLGAIKITAEYAIWNKASEKVLLNNGFTFVRLIEEGLMKNGKWQSEHQYAIDKGHWERFDR